MEERLMQIFDYTMCFLNNFSFTEGPSASRECFSLGLQDSLREEVNFPDRSSWFTLQNITGSKHKYLR